MTTIIKKTEVCDMAMWSLQASDDIAGLEIGSRGPVNAHTMMVSPHKAWTTKSDAATGKYIGVYDGIHALQKDACKVFFITSSATTVNDLDILISNTKGENVMWEMQTDGEVSAPTMIPTDARFLFQNNENCTFNFYEHE